MKKIFATMILCYGALATEFTDCSRRQQVVLKRAIVDTKRAQVHLIKEIDYNIETRKDELSKHVIKKLRKAKYTLKCANARMDKLKYDCSEKEDVDYFMRVLPIIGNTVEVASMHLDNASYPFIVGSLTHEATHKCGTGDGTYFYQRGKKPDSIWYKEWHNIASTYDYWVIKGFCVPNVDC